MARFLFISGCGEGLGLALRLKDAGHEVVTYIKEKSAKANFDGILKKVDDWNAALTPDTTVIFDSSGGGRTADRLRAQGSRVLCSSVFADSLEKDRDFGLEIMQSVGIRVPESQKFTSWEKGRAYAKKLDQKLVFKPSGKLGEEIASYVASDAEDLIEMLTWYEEETPRKVPVEFELQEFKPGFEISTEGWFNGENWVLPFNHTLERKALMNDDVGPSGGCAGNIVWKAEKTNFIIEQGIKLMTPVLRQQEFNGPLDLNAIVDEEGTLWGLEFSPRFGYDALPSILELFEEDIGAFLSALALGHGQVSSMKLKEGFASGVRVTLNPYPADKLKGPVGIPIRGLVKTDRPHLYFYDVALNERGKLISTEKICFCATGVGASVDEAMQKAYEIVYRSKIPNAQYRTDLEGVLAGRHEDFLELLKKWNPLTPPVVQTSLPEVQELSVAALRS